MSKGAPKRNAKSKGALSGVTTHSNDLSVYTVDSAARADAKAIAQLRTSLDALAHQLAYEKEPDAQIELTRPHAIALLNCLYHGLVPSLHRPVDDDLDVFVEHPAMSLLQNIVGILSDLDNAKTDRALQPSSRSRGASKTSAEARRRGELVALLEVVKLADSLPTLAAAAQKVRNMMVRKVGRKNAITAYQLLELRRTLCRRARRESSRRES